MITTKPAAIHVVHVNLSGGFGGGERQTELLLRHLAEYDDVRQTLVCRRDSPLRARLGNAVQVVANHAWQGHASVQRATLVHAHEARAVHWAWLHRALRGVPYLLTRRMDKPVRTHGFNRVMYRQASCVVALSSAIAAQVRALRTDAIACIPSACARLPHDPQETARLRAAFPPGFMVGHVASLVDRVKGQRVLLQAARLLREQAPDMQFLFLGTGRDAAALAQESTDMPNVHWLGFCQNIGDWLGILDAFALPSRSEGMGSSLLDAMDYGIPIVASRVGGIPDIVHDGQTGLLTPAGDAQALAQALLRLYRDPPLRQQLVAHARTMLSDYTPQRMAQRYLELYRTVACQA